MEKYLESYGARDYQIKAIQDIYSFFASGGLHCILQAATGAGKTWIFSLITKMVSNKNKRILILTDRAELLRQADSSINKLGIKTTYIIAGSKMVNKTFNCYIGMSQTLKRRVSLDYWVDFLKGIDLLVVDECFIAGTKVNNKNIEDIKIGDYVNSFNHKTNKIEKKKVINTFKSNNKSMLLKINLTYAHLVCTQKHPIFVINKGYVNAENLKNGDRVILHSLQFEDEKRRLSSKQLVRQNKKIQKKWIYFLFNKMQSNVFCSNAFRENEKKQSNVKKGNQGKSFKNIKKNRAQTKSSWREWTWNDSFSKKIIRSFRRFMVSRISNYNWKWIFAISLQNRYRKSIIKNSNRSGWSVSQFTYFKKKRRQKKNVLRIERIQSIEVYKSANNGKFERSFSGNNVYNLEVEDNNNYFANGILVHNCHKQEFNYIFESGIFDKKHVIGFTATPRRTGKMRQLALDYEKIIETISIYSLIQQGYLVNDDYYGFGSPDLSDVDFDYLKGDYKEKSLFKKFDNPKTYSGAVKNYLELVHGTKSICFCVNIEHCIRIAIEFNKTGVKAKFVVSDVAKPKYPESNDPAKIAYYEEKLEIYELYQQNKHLTGKRQNIFKEFDQGFFDILINAGIATTGFDQPDIETVIVLRATLSTTLWLQMIGRGSRPWPGKTHFNILDFGGNAERLGHYSEDRIWSLWHETFEGNGLPPIKECGIDSKGKPITDKPGCKRPILASYKICPFCGFIYPEKEHKEIDLELTILDQQLKHSIKKKKLKDMTFHELHDYRKVKGHKMAWLWRQLWYRGGEECIREFGGEFNWSNSTVEKAVSFMKR